MTCSQVFTNLVFSPDNALKSETLIVLNLYRILLGDWLSCAPPIYPPLPMEPRTWVQPLLDQLLRFYPLGLGKNGDMCSSPVCHRCTLVFGRCFTHVNLNHATHVHMGSWFSGIHMHFLSHLIKMGNTPPYHVRSNEKIMASYTSAPETESGFASDNNFVDLVLEKGNMERLKGLQIQFVSGGANAVFDPRSTAESYEMFRERFPKGRYERVVVEGYGHLDTWMGVRSQWGVYPRVAAHVELCEGVTQGNDVDDEVEGFVEM
jgi:hypothetical protein